MTRVRMAAAAVAAVLVVAVLVLPGLWGGEGLRAESPKGDPCPAVDASNLALVRGGCRALPDSAPLRIEVLTMFGPTHFATCDTALTTRVGPDGELWIMDMWFAGEEGAGLACGDVLQCRRRDSGRPIEIADKVPWRGMPEPSGPGTYEVRLDLCFDTCLGTLEGEVVFELSSRSNGWVLSLDKATVGTSGLRLDGEWVLDREAFSLSRDA